MTRRQKLRANMDRAYSLFLAENCKSENLLVMTAQCRQLREAWLEACRKYDENDDER